MRKAICGFVLRATVAVKDFGERRKIDWLTDLGKYLREAAIKRIKVGWLV